MIEKSLSQVELVIKEIRKLSHSLADPSLDDISLPEALKHMMDQINVGKKLRINFMNSLNGTKVDKGKELTLYRIAQEQTNNIIKYAQANEITFYLKSCGNTLMMRITDDGIGFDKSKTPKGIGLKNIGNRGNAYSGKMKLVTSPGHGCSLSVYLPL